MLPFFDRLKNVQKELKDTTSFELQPWPVLIAGLAVLMMAFIFAPSMVSLAFSLALFLAPLWLPLLIVGGAWAVWVVWRRGEFTASQKTILLEIKLPRNVVKTPLAMEAFLSALNISGGESNWYLKWIKGSVRPWWSLEMASFGGQVHFYIWTRTLWRPMVESQLYAQYPGVQLVEAPDYTRFISASSEDGWGVWGCDFKHTEPDPIPIKTYIEYGLDKVQKEPEQVDPLANLIEFMSSIGKDEDLWLQFVFRYHKGEKYHKMVKVPGKSARRYTWKDKAKELIDDIRKSTRDPYVDPVTGEERPGFPNPTKGQIEKIGAIERNISKLAFDVGVRGIYLVKPGKKFNVVFVLNMISLFKPFNTEGWNNINSTAWMKKFDDYPWDIGINKRKDIFRRKMVEAFRRRQFFYEPFSEGLPHDDIMVMSTEELATVYHIPSQAVTTPTLSRIQSATSEAPANLPV